MRRLNDVTRERIFNALSCDNNTIMPKPELHSVFAMMINVERQYVIFVNTFIHVLILNLIENGLPVLSGRGRQTHRSENSQVVSGNISLMTVRSTPLIHTSKKIIYLPGRDILFGVNRERLISEIFCQWLLEVSKVIHVGRQLIVCIHFSSSRLVMDINGLPVLSDRGCQTCRSENSRAVIGIISLATVRSTPLIHISKKSFYLQGWGGLFLINGGLFNA